MIPLFGKDVKHVKNFDVLTRTEHKMCLCTGMLYDPALAAAKKEKLNVKAFKRLKRIKQQLFLKRKNK